MRLSLYIQFHPLIKPVEKDEIHGALFAAMRLGFCEGTPDRLDLIQRGPVGYQ